MVSYDFLLFMLKIAIPRFPAGSFAVHIGDHLRSSLGIVSGVGIICGRGSFAALYRRPKTSKEEEKCVASAIPR